MQMNRSHKNFSVLFESVKNTGHLRFLYYNQNKVIRNEYNFFKFIIGPSVADITALE